MGQGSAGGSAKLGPFGAGAVVTGNMLGSGIYLLPATLGAVGSITVIGWLVTLAAVLVLALACSMLALARPAAPGLTGYVAAGLGRSAGFQASYLYWMSVVLGNGAIALAAASYLVRIAPVAPTGTVIVGLSIALIVLSALINVRGARSVAGFGAASLVLGLAPVAIIVTAGWLRFDPALFRASWNVTGRSDLAAVTGALPSIAWAFLGFESATAAALVVRDPERNVPIATVGGVLVAGLIYALLSAAMFGLAPAAALAASPAPLADVATRLWGPWLGLGIAAAAALKAMGTLAGWTLVGGETAVAGVEVGVFPALARGRRGSLRAYLLIGAAIMIVTTLLSQAGSIGAQFGLLINSTTLLCLIVYAACGAALVRLRDAFPSARGRLAARVIGGAAVAISVALILACDRVLLLFAAGLMLSGVALSFALRRARRP